MNRERKHIQSNIFSNLEQSRLEIALSKIPLSSKKKLWKSVYELEKRYSELDNNEREYELFVIKREQKREENYQRIYEIANFMKLVSKNYTKN